MKPYDADKLLESVSRFAFNWVIILSVPVFYSTKNLPAILWLITVIALLYGNARRRVGCVRVLILSILAAAITTASLFSPIDICVRKGDTFHFAIKPVVVCDGTLAPARELYANGKLPGKDYVLYRCRRKFLFFNQVKWALTIVIPGRSEENERLIGHLEDFHKLEVKVPGER